MADAICSYKTFLMMKDTSASPATWSKVVDIKSTPDLGGSPERIEVTTLSDKMKTYIEGVQDTGEITFDANYNHTDYTTLKALKGLKKTYAVWFGGTESAGVLTPDGSNGKFKFDGTLDVFVKGAGVNEAVGMTITITPSSVIEEDV